MSLAELPEVHGDRSLELALREQVENWKAHAPNHADAPLWDAAIELILALDQRDQTPDAQPAAFQVAVESLLNLGQAQLLCRLAQLNPSFDFVLDVGPNPQRAEVLARIGASWPQDVAVSLTLDAGLAADATFAMKTFVRWPTRLSLHVRADNIVDRHTAPVMELVVGRRSLAALSLHINEMSVPILKALCGVTAPSVCIVAAHATSDRHADTSTASASEGDDEEAEALASVPTFTEDQISAYQSAAIDLVRRSGARVLRLPQSHLDEALCLRLLASRSDWETVAFNAHGCVGIMDWLSAGQQAIHRLELSMWAPANSADMNDLLASAAKNGVHTIVFHSAVNLRLLADGLGNHLLQSTHMFEWIEACFVVDEDDQNLGAVFFDHLVVVPLLGNPMVATLRHKPLAALPSAPISSPEGVPIGDDLKAKLNTMSALNRLVSPSERQAKAQRAVEKQRQRTVQEIGFCLSCEGDTTGLVCALIEMPSAFAHPQSGSTGGMPVFEPSVKGMFDVFRWYGVEAWLIKGAVAQCVHDHPTMGPQMARGVMGSGLPLNQRAPADWRIQGALSVKRWPIEAEMKRYQEALASGDNMKKYEGLKPDIFSLIAPPIHPDPNAPVSGPKTMETDGPGSKAAVEAAPVVGVLSTPTDPSSLVNSREVLVHLKAHFQQMADAQQAHTPASVATRIIQHLLGSGEFDPALVVRHATVGRDVAAQLLERGQGRLLKYIIEHTPPSYNWEIDVVDATAAKAVLDLKPWPQDARCLCTLRLHANLLREDGALLATFARTVQAEQLALAVATQPHAAPEVLESIIASHPGLHLALSSESQPIDIDATERMLNSVKTRLGALSLFDLQSDDTRLVNAVMGLIVRADVKSLTVRHCSPVLTQTVVTRRRWETLKVGSVVAATAPFASGQVSAEKLYIGVQRLPHEDVDACVETMVAQCKGLKAVEFEFGQVHALSLARGLDRNRSVQWVNAKLQPLGDVEMARALAIFRRNTSLVYFDLGDSAIAPSFQQAIRQLVTRNRMRHPDLVARGAGSGFGLGLPAHGLDMRDGGAHIAGMLGARDVIALSRVNTAAYLASMQPWENEVDRLAALFGVAHPGEFKTQLVRQLTHLHKTFSALSGTAPSAETPATTLLDRVSVMQTAGVPDVAIGEALRRSLSFNLASSQACLEAMVTVGAYPAEVWLKDIAGIDVQALAGEPQG